MVEQVNMVVKFQTTSFPETLRIRQWIIPEEKKTLYPTSVGTIRKQTRENILLTPRDCSGVQAPKDRAGSFFKCPNVCTHGNISFHPKELCREELGYIQLCHLAVTTIFALVGLQLILAWLNQTWHVTSFVICQ